MCRRTWWAWAPQGSEQGQKQRWLAAGMSSCLPGGPDYTPTNNLPRARMRGACCIVPLAGSRYLGSNSGVLA